MMKCAAALMMLVLGVAARPHFNPAVVETEGHFVGTMYIVHGCYPDANNTEGYPTNKITMTFPNLGDDIPLLFVHPGFLPDWNITVEWRDLVKPYAAHRHNVTKTVTKITWQPTEVASIPYNFMIVLPMRFKTLKVPVGTKLNFNVTQTCPGTADLEFGPAYRQPTLPVVAKPPPPPTTAPTTTPVVTTP